MPQGRATLLGHPLHLISVSFPVAAWTGAVITDVAALRSPDPFWPRMSVTLIAAGVVSGALAALLGFIDYRTAPMTRRARGIANAHLVTSLATLVLYALAWLLRSTNALSTAGITVSMLGAVALLAGGYYGSELSNRYRIGIRDAD